MQLLSHTDRTTEKSPSSNSLREETKEKEEVVNAESNGVFFLDNEGENIAGVTKVHVHILFCNSASYELKPVMLS